MFSHQHAELFERLVVPISGTVRPEEVITTEIVPVAQLSVPVLVVSAVFAVLCTAWTIFRLWARRMRGKPMHVEDYVAVVALISFYGLCVCNFLVVSVGGSGHHILTLQPYHISRMSRIIFAIQALFAICLGAVKIGLCFMLKRIFVVQTFHVLTWIVMAICIGWVLFTIIIGFTICQPVAMNWDPATPGGTCGNQLAGFAAVGILDLITDGALLLLPVPMVIRLQMRWQHKIALLAIFGAGALTMVFAGMRLHAVLTLDFLDVTYSQVPVVLYGTLEPAIAILVSCSVPLQPLLDAFFTSALRWDRSNSSRNSTKQSSTELSDLSSDKSREGGSFRARSPTPGRGFRQIEEGGYNDLELDGFRRTGRDILVAADSTESFHGSDVGLRVKVVDTVDVTRSERGQRPRG